MVAIFSGGFHCVCGRIYSQAHNLRRHQKYECGKAPRFVCTICRYKCFRRNVMKDHLQNKHNQDNFKFIEIINNVYWLNSLFDDIQKKNKLVKYKHENILLLFVNRSLNKEKLIQKFSVLIILLFVSIFCEVFFLLDINKIKFLEEEYFKLIEFLWYL